MSKRYKARERQQLVAAVRTSGEPVKVVAKRLGSREADTTVWDIQDGGRRSTRTGSHHRPTTGKKRELKKVFPQSKAEEVFAWCARASWLMGEHAGSAMILTVTFEKRAV